MYVKLVDPQPFGQLASAACAVALALRLRGRKDDQDWAALLDKLGRRAQMCLAGPAGRAQPGDDDDEPARTAGPTA